MGGIVDTFTGKSGKRAASTINEQGERLASAQERATEFQIQAEQKALELQRQAAEASERFLQTGIDAERKIALKASEELDRLINSSEFQQQSLADPSFKQRIDTISQGFGQALQTQEQAQLGQLEALRSGTQQAVQAGQPFSQAGTAGIQAFQQSALDPNNPLFQRRLAEGQEALNKQLAARGQFNTGAALELQRKFVEQATAEEQQNQINRQAQLAQLGQPQVGMQQQLLAQQGAQTAGVIGQGGQNIANLQTGQAGALSDLQRQQLATNLGIQQQAAQQQAARIGTTAGQLQQMSSRGATNLANLASGAGAAQAAGESTVGAVKGQGQLGVAEALAQSRINAAKTRQASDQALTSGVMSLAGAAIPGTNFKKLGSSVKGLFS